MNTSTRFSLAAIFFFALAVAAPSVLNDISSFTELKETHRFVAMLLQALLQLMLVLAGLFVGHGLGAHPLAELGLTRSVIRGILFGLAVTSPMLITYGIGSRGVTAFTVSGVVFGALLQPFIEELLFRGFLFGQLYRRARWPFFPAALITAIIFGIGHTWQAVTGDLGWGGVVGIVLVTGIGSLFFSWLFMRWNFNLWVPFFVHAMMNLWWEIFQVDETALGGWGSNLPRIGVLVLAIGGTIWWTNQKRDPADTQPKNE